MNRERPIGVHLLRVLVAGFTLLILLLVACVYVGIDAMRSAEYSAARLVEDQRATLRLIDDIQRNEDSLSAVFILWRPRPNVRIAPLCSRASKPENVPFGAPLTPAAIPATRSYGRK
jgi:hypothetical protein